MTQLSDVALARYASAAGFTGNALVTAIAVALAESGGRTDARNVNRNTAGQATSIDRGLWQINNVYHAEVSDSCAYNPSCAASAAYRISRSGSNWSQWHTYTAGAYKQFTARGLAAVTTLGQQVSGTGVTPAPAPGATGATGTATNALSYQPVTDALVSGTAQVETLGDQNQDVFGPYRLMLAIALMFMALYLITRTRAGYAAVYYGQVLILLFLFVTQSTFIKEALSPLSHLTQPVGQ